MRGVRHTLKVGYGLSVHLASCVHALSPEVIGGGGPFTPRPLVDEPDHVERRCDHGATLLDLFSLGVGIPFA
jgi:hypothetical protein